MRYALAIFLLSLVGCVTPNYYHQFYQGNTDARLLPGYENTGEDVRVYNTQDLERDEKAICRDGYGLVGKSIFNYTGHFIEHAKEQARQIGAQVVLLSSRYAGTESGAVPLFLPNNTVSQTDMSARTYGGGDTIRTYGNATTNTYGNQVVMAPYSVRRFDLVADFFAKNKSRLGVQVLPLDDRTKQRLESNMGAKVNLIVNQSPAFYANILEGDVILKLNDTVVESAKGFVDLLGQYDGQTITLDLDRNGEKITKTVTLLKLNP